ncbi:hypothetical protein BLI708_00080 [Bifidobacterium imperatoris]|uniref:Mobilization protein n=1 Tax=Bifidobacterium imperatoris TaxID=2020965 RepID=A0ABX7S0N3_9BIFI|nr:hypothetical protein [Bifidobacterium imperatoris]QSY57784.1 hypothetical protein BLI708_00080 [Bifidobacterium imperatoris]
MKEDIILQKKRRHMELQVHSPYTSVEIVTNMTALRAAIELTNRINELKALENMTEAEASAARGEREKLAKQLSKTVQDVQKSTLTVTLEGLRANEWNQLILRCTSMENGRQSRDMNRLLQLAFPAHAACHQGSGRQGHGSVTGIGEDLIG